MGCNFSELGDKIETQKKSLDIPGIIVSGTAYNAAQLAVITALVVLLVLSVGHVIAALGITNVVAQSSSTLLQIVKWSGIACGGAAVIGLLPIAIGFLINKCGCVQKTYQYYSSGN